MPPAEPAPTPAQVLALGLLQGPTELLPVSSSAHTTLLPWLAGSSYAKLDPGLRKSLEVALHAGAGLALALHMRGEARDWIAALSRRRAGALALALAPPALAGLLARGQVERRLSGPSAIALGLVVGSGAMAMADRRQGTRGCEEVGARDGLALGVAQALALAPGISRNGATLAAARARGFTRGGAWTLSWVAGLPVLLGVGALEAVRLTGRRLRPLLALAAAASFVSTLAAARLSERVDARDRRLVGYAIYRCLLAAAVLRRALRSQWGR